MSPSIGSALPLKGLRVLIVEDEELIAMLIEDFLAELGCEVIGPATTIAAAMPLAQSVDMAGALLDLNLNGEPVYPVADSLAARGIPFIFTTGYAQEDVIARHSDVPTLAKPFGSKLLQDTIIARFLGRATAP